MAPKSLRELPKTANKAPWSFPRLEDFWISQLDSGVLGIQNQSLEFQDWTLNFKTELDLTSRLDFWNRNLHFKTELDKTATVQKILGGNYKFGFQHRVKN